MKRNWYTIGQLAIIALVCTHYDDWTEVRFNPLFAARKVVPTSDGRRFENVEVRTSHRLAIHRCHKASDDVSWIPASEIVAWFNRCLNVENLLRGDGITNEIRYNWATERYSVERGPSGEII